MNQKEIKTFLETFTENQLRTLVIVDYGNVEKWKNSLNWNVGIRQLGSLVKHFSKGKQPLRRFYYGADYGSDEKSTVLVGWSKSVLETARNNHFEVITKRVKYIHDRNNSYGFNKKCDLDVEMAIDLVKERDNYDTVILFSGDGDLMYAIRYLKESYGKICFVIGARGHIGREVVDSKISGHVENVLFADDFEYRLNARR